MPKLEALLLSTLAVSLMILRNPEPETRNPTPETLKPDTDILDPYPQTLNSETEILNPKPLIQVQNSVTEADHRFGVCLR
jgi:hypothetical protein